MSAPSTEELRKAIAAIFLGEGLDRMTEEQMLTAISMKRRWFSPEKAKAMIENGRRSGLLIDEGGFLRPSFDYREVEIPFGYYPPEEVAEVHIESMKERLKRELGLSDEEVKDALSMNYNLADEVKILLWAGMHGKRYKHLIDDVEKDLLVKGIT